MLHLRTRRQRITALAFSPDGRYLAAGGTSTRVDVWDFGQTKSKHTVLPPPAHRTAAVRFIPTSHTATVLFTPANLLVTITQQVLQLYDTAAAKLHPAVTLMYGFDLPSGAALSADGTALFTCWGIRSRRLDVSPIFLERWKATNIGPERLALYGQPGCFVDATGRFVVPMVGDWQRKWTLLRTHDPETGKVVGERKYLERWTESFRATPDGATGAYLDGRKLHAGPLAGTKLPPVAEVPDLPKSFRAVAFHPSGKWLMCGTETGVRIYETATWREAKVLAWDAGALQVLAFDADGTRAAGGGKSGTVVVWDWDL
jgi:WD40 repeat protein